MKKKVLVFFSSVVFCLVLAAHEFWIQPQRFRYKAGQAVKLKFHVGENFNGENWSGNRSTVQQIHLYFNGYDDDIRNLLSENTSGDSLTVQFFDEGTVTVTCLTENKHIELDAPEFLEYLKEDSLTETIAYREEHGESDSIGRELYQRNVKSIIQVGTKLDSGYNRETGLPVDIIPLSHPYLIKKTQRLSAKVLFEGKPLINQTIKLWSKTNGHTEMKSLITDENGIVEMDVKPIGQWMLSTVKMIRLENDSTANWQSYWGSLTWGYF